MQRLDARRFDEGRPVEIITGFQKYPHGSALISTGNTKVICAAHVESRLPSWLSDGNHGWVTAEYAFLPGAGTERSRRGKTGGRAHEIQRLIGRSLRAVTDLEALGQNMITVDCDVLQADGGTRTASITGAFVALVLAMDRMRQMGLLDRLPLVDTLSAISAGVVENDILLDLCYDEDSRAEVDANFVFSGQGNVVEVQAASEGVPFSRDTFNKLYDVSLSGCDALKAAQKHALGSLWDEIVK